MVEVLAGGLVMKIKTTFFLVILAVVAFVLPNVSFSTQERRTALVNRPKNPSLLQTHHSIPALVGCPSASASLQAPKCRIQHRTRQ